MQVNAPDVFPVAPQTHPMIAPVKHTAAKLTESQAREIRDRLIAGESAVAIAEDYPVNENAVCRIRRGQQWAWATGVRRGDIPDGRQRNGRGKNLRRVYVITVAGCFDRGMAPREIATVIARSRDDASAYGREIGGERAFLTSNSSRSHTTETEDRIYKAIPLGYGNSKPKCTWQPVDGNYTHDGVPLPSETKEFNGLRADIDRGWDYFWSNPKRKDVRPIEWEWNR